MLVYSILKVERTAMVNGIRIISLFTLLAMPSGVKAMDTLPIDETDLVPSITIKLQSNPSNVDETKSPPPPTNKYRVKESKNIKVRTRRQDVKDLSTSREGSGEFIPTPVPRPGSILAAMQKLKVLHQRSRSSSRHNSPMGSLNPSPTSSPPSEQEDKEPAQQHQAVKRKKSRSITSLDPAHKGGVGSSLHRRIKSQSTTSQWLLNRSQGGTPKNNSEDEGEDSESLEDRVRNFMIDKQDAEGGDPEAQNELGIRYLKGDGTSKDEKEAARIFSLAAKNGCADAEFNLGNLYMNGCGVPQDLEKGFNLCKSAADKGVRQALLLVGKAYRDGQVTTQNYENAFHYYSLAVHKGSSQAMNELADLFAKGLGIAENPEEASRLTHLAAEKGNAESQYYLALAYRDMKKLETAEKWLQCAAAKEYPEAMAQLKLVRKERSTLSKHQETQ